MSVNRTQNAQSWIPFIPAVAALAVGSVVSPPIAVGVVTGAALYGFNRISIYALNRMNLIKHEAQQSTYSKRIKQDIVGTTFYTPIFEEIIYRGAVLEIVKKIAIRSLLSYPPRMLLLSTTLGPVPIATAAAITVSSVLFGCVHLFNNHANNKIQAGLAMASGFVLGILSQPFGLLASMAAHIFNNTVATRRLLRA